MTLLSFRPSSIAAALAVAMLAGCAVHPMHVADGIEEGIHRNALLGHFLTHQASPTAPGGKDGE